MKREIHENSERMQKAFGLAMNEIEEVLSRKKTITDITRLAANTVSNFSRILSTEIHNKALELMISKKGPKGNIPLIE